MQNLLNTNLVMCGNVYVIEMENGETNSYRIIGETPSHYILSSTKEDGAVEVFEKAKKDLTGIFDVREWWSTQKN